MATDPVRVSDLNACFIKIENGGDPVLWILLARDGSINRQGDGTPTPADRHMFIGVVKEPLFDQLMEVVPDELFRHGGWLELENREGIDTTLGVMFQHDDGREIPFEVLFGSESGGVPPEIQAILGRALELTDPWWNEQRKVIERLVPRRPDI